MSLEGEHRVYITFWQECRKYLCYLGDSTATTFWSKEIKQATLYERGVGEIVLAALKKRKNFQDRASLKLKDVIY